MMAQNFETAEAEDSKSKPSMRCNHGKEVPPFRRKSRYEDTKPNFKEGASDELKAEWATFFAELELWRQQRYEEMVNDLKEEAPNIKPGPRVDTDWMCITFNRPRDILAGIAPPVPPGMPRLTLEEVLEKERQQEKGRQQEKKRQQEKEKDSEDDDRMIQIDETNLAA